MLYVDSAPVRGKFVSLFEIRWLDTQFQNAVDSVSVGIIQSGVEDDGALTRLKDNPGDADDDFILWGLGRSSCVIMFYMALNNKDEYAKYWGAQPEDMVFHRNSTSLDSLNLYKLLQWCFGFNAVPTTLDQDAELGSF
ncbi:hypothetical protein ON010_g15237 [Phytophthora cinnamomi]|nr:hypothetical protein ON010_g15237 [Phytophthora cinnamomi]